MSASKRSVEILLTLLLSIAVFLAPATVLGVSYNYQVLSGKHTASGEQRALIILVEFQDVRHTQSPSQIKVVAIDELNNYYAGVSRGKVSITGEVYGWYTANHPISHYGQDNKNPGDDDNVRALAVDALSLLPSTADLSSFNFLVIVHAGQDQATDKSNVRSDEIWSSCFCEVFPNYLPFRSISAHSKVFNSYAFVSEFNGFGTFAHEWGHFFGLPDLYDADSGDNYVGYWSLMDAGSWCCFNEKQTTPSEIGAWGDALLGWLTPSVADTRIVVSAFALNPLESPIPTAILIPISSNTYYFIEYRTPTGIDSYLPGSGVLVYYVDETIETGHGILRLEDPKTGKIYPAQERTRALNGATFQNGDQFRDVAHQVYIAFLGGKEASTMLYSKQELTGAILQSHLRTSSIPVTASYGDQITLSGNLVGENGTPITGQTVEADILDPASNQWQTIGSTMTGQQGEISLQVKLSVRVGDYRFRLLYPGGKIGSTWYSSSSTDFLMSITPAIMKIAISFPKITAPDRISVEVSATRSNGEPLPGVTFEIYVDNVRRGIVQTDANGKATLALYFGFGEMGSHAIAAKAFTENYLPANTTDSVLIIPPLWLIGTVAAVVLAVRAFRVVKRRSGSSQTKLEGSAVLCTNCGAELPPDSSFCLRCGAHIARNQ